MPVAHHPPPAIIGKLVGMAAEQARTLGLNRLRQKRSRAVAQNLGQRIGKSSWLPELENISLSHGVSLLRWRSGGLEHPHDTPPYPFTPSPTFAYSSAVVAPISINEMRFLPLCSPHSSMSSTARLACASFCASRARSTTFDGRGSFLS